MADLNNILRNTTPENVVNTMYESKHIPRNYLGLSEIGNECERALWYTHNGYEQKPIAGRILRLFELGNVIEDLVVNDLISAGYIIKHTQGDVEFEFEGLKLRGHIDGEISNLIESSKTHLLEIKSASNKRFTNLKKVGYEKWDEKYKSQIHVYMLGRKLERCLVWVENKDTSESYTERIKLNKSYAVGRLERAFKAISGACPERKCPRPDWYKAKWCNFYEECF